MARGVFGHRENIGVAWPAVSARGEWDCKYWGCRHTAKPGYKGGFRFQYKQKLHTTPREAAGSTHGTTNRLPSVCYRYCTLSSAVCAASTPHKTPSPLACPGRARAQPTVAHRHHRCGLRKGTEPYGLCWHPTVDLTAVAHGHTPLLLEATAAQLQNNSTRTPSPPPRRWGRLYFTFHFSHRRLRDPPRDCALSPQRCRDRRPCQPRRAKPASPPQHPRHRRLPPARLGERPPRCALLLAPPLGRTATRSAAETHLDCRS